MALCVTDYLATDSPITAGVDGNDYREMIVIAMMGVQLRIPIKPLNTIEP